MAVRVSSAYKGVVWSALVRMDDSDDREVVDHTVPVADMRHIGLPPFLNYSDAST